MKRIYLDYAATTYLDPRVLKKITPYFQEIAGNPSSFNWAGKQAKKAIEKARADVAGVLGARASEIIFTGSGTEADNLAIFGISEAYQNRGRHIITTGIEHKAVLEPCRILESKGFRVTYLKPDNHGIINLEDLKKALKKNTILISVMYANNEMGSVQPIQEIGKIVKEFRQSNAFPVPLFHTDACQAAGALSLKVDDLGVDLLTLNGSKIYGPKGSGCLYVRRGTDIKPRIVGGGQENHLRAGTENVPWVVGLAEALKLTERSREKESRRLAKLRDYFIAKVLSRVPKIRLNGHPVQRLPNNINLSILDVEGEALILELDKYGIIAATGSACTSVSLDPSHVLLIMGISPEAAHGSLRITLGRKTTKKDLDYVLNVLPKAVQRLRKISSVKTA